MYPQDGEEDTHSLPVQGSEREPTLAAPQILQRPDVENHAREVPEYFADATAPEWAGPGQPLERRSRSALPTYSGTLVSETSGRPNKRAKTVTLTRPREPSRSCIPDP